MTKRKLTDLAEGRRVRVQLELREREAAAIANQLGEPCRLEFSPSGSSNLSGLLEMAATLPAIRYDPTRVKHIVEISEDEKQDALEQIQNGLLGLTQTIRLVGLMMATEAAKGGQLFADSDHADLGFSINGLADLVEQLVRVNGTLGEAVAIGR